MTIIPTPHNVLIEPTSSLEDEIIEGIVVNVARENIDDHYLEFKIGEKVGFARPDKIIEITVDSKKLILIPVFTIQYIIEG